MKARNIIYSLRNVGDKTILSIDLTAKILSEESHEIIISLPTGVSNIRKKEYLNTMKIYQVDEKLFFLICTKAVSRQSVFESLLKHALIKIEATETTLGESLTNLSERLTNVQQMKHRLQKELSAA